MTALCNGRMRPAAERFKTTSVRYSTLQYYAEWEYNKFVVLEQTERFVCRPCVQLVDANECQELSLSRNVSGASSRVPSARWAQVDGFVSNRSLIGDHCSRIHNGVVRQPRCHTPRC